MTKIKNLKAYAQPKTKAFKAYTSGMYSLSVLLFFTRNSSKMMILRVSVLFFESFYSENWSVFYVSTQ